MGPFLWRWRGVSIHPQGLLDLSVLDHDVAHQRLEHVGCDAHVGLEQVAVLPKGGDNVLPPDAFYPRPPPGALELLELLPLGRRTVRHASGPWLLPRVPPAGRCVQWSPCVLGLFGPRGGVQIDPDIIADCDPVLLSGEELGHETAFQPIPRRVSDHSDRFALVTDTAMDRVAKSHVRVQGDPATSADMARRVARTPDGLPGIPHPRGATHDMPCKSNPVPSLRRGQLTSTRATRPRA